MNKENVNANVYNEENVLAGIIGALLFSLVGGVLWYVLYQVGFLAAISGLVGVICAIKGYTVFSKKESIKGIIISVIVAVIVIIIAWYFCLANDVYVAYKDWYANGEIDYVISFSDAVRGAYTYLFDMEIAIAYLKDLGIGLLLCIVGAGSYVSNAIKKIKANNTAQETVEGEPEQPIEATINEE